MSVLENYLQLEHLQIERKAKVDIITSPLDNAIH